MQGRVFGDNSAMEFHKLRRGIWQNEMRSGIPIHRQFMDLAQHCEFIKDIILTVLPQYWGQNTRDSRGDGEQACDTTKVMELGFSHVRVIL